MASHREDVDLWLVLTDPRCARMYIETFPWSLHFPEQPRAIITKRAGRRIQIDCMTDDEAVVLATELLGEYEIETVKAEFRTAEALGRIC